MDEDGAVLGKSVRDIKPDMPEVNFEKEADDFMERPTKFAKTSTATSSNTAPKHDYGDLLQGFDDPDALDFPPTPDVAEGMMDNVEEKVFTAEGMVDTTAAKVESLETAIVKVDVKSDAGGETDNVKSEVEMDCKTLSQELADMVEAGILDQLDA
eukprot:6483117-Amphidinium_carterae.1